MESGEPAKLPMHLGACVMRDETTVAELTWVLKMIESDYSGKSAPGISRCIWKKVPRYNDRKLLLWTNYVCLFFLQKLWALFSGNDPS